MAIETVNAQLFSKMFLAGAKNLEVKKEWINELNVFPVPDGDTGTNMTLTILSAANEVAAMEKPTMDSLAKAISSGSLRGARGNSGVILSQLFRGLSKVIREHSELTTTVWAQGLTRAAETAYKAVMKPKEGTILTVARGIAEKAAEICEEEKDVEAFFRAVVEHGNAVLQTTPDLLPVLKQAGVVDSGGQGLMVILEGFLDGLTGKEVNFDFEKPHTTSLGVDTSHIETANIKYGYCTEFIVMLEKPYDQQEEQKFKNYLTSIGDSLVLVSDDELVKVHVHTNDPGLAIQKGLSYGSLTKMKIDNMREEHHEKVIKDAQKIAAAQLEEEQKKKAATPAVPEKPYGFVAVSVGDGLTDIFKGLGVDQIIAGGQTMNPSTEDFLDAIAQVPAENIFLLPNNKNIILAAEQAAKLTKDKKIFVVPTKTVPQGIAAVISFQSGKEPEVNLQTMTEEIGNVKTGQVTYAVRNTNIEGKEIHEHDIMGIGDSRILAVGEIIQDTTMDMLREMITEDSEIVSIYYGADITKEEAGLLEEAVAAAFPNIDIDLHEGGQPIYYYIVSVE